MKSNNIKRQKLLKELQNNGGNILRACQALDMPTVTYYDWLKRYPDFKEQVDKLFETQFTFVEGKLFDLIEDKNPTAIIFWLKTKAKDKGYIEKQEIKVDSDQFEVKLN